MFSTVLTTITPIWRPGFRDKNLMHDQVRQINTFYSVFLFKKSFQKKEQLAIWLIELMSD